MIVYFVWLNNFHGVDEFLGVYSTEEKAQARIDCFSKWDQSALRIEPTELDDF